MKAKKLTKGIQVATGLAPRRHKESEGLPALDSFYAGSGRFQVHVNHGFGGTDAVSLKVLWNDYTSGDEAHQDEEEARSLLPAVLAVAIGEDTAAPATAAFFATPDEPGAMVEVEAVAIGGPPAVRVTFFRGPLADERMAVVTWGER